MSGNKEDNDWVWEITRMPMTNVNPLWHKWKLHLARGLQLKIRDKALRRFVFEQIRANVLKEEQVYWGAGCMYERRRLFLFLGDEKIAEQWEYKECKRRKIFHLK
jgi:hypothetical protein